MPNMHAEHRARGHAQLRCCGGASNASTSLSKISIFRTNRCPELQTYSKKTGPTRHALQAPSQHRRSSFWTLTQPIREPTSLKLAQTDPKWPPSDRAIWRANGRARPKPRADRHVKRRQSAHHVCTCVCRHQLPPYHDHRGHMRATAVPPVATCDAGARDRPITRQAATIQQRGLTGSARRRWNRTDSQRRVRCHHSSQAPPHLSARRETTDIVPVRVGREGDAFDSPRGKARQGERAHACSMAA